MGVNYIFGNGFSITVSSSFKYENLLKGFVKRFEKDTGFRLPLKVETNPEVYLGSLYSKIPAFDDINTLDDKNRKYIQLLVRIQAHLKNFIYNKIKNAPKPDVKYKLHEFKNQNETKVATTNYDTNVEEVFQIKFIEHLHGSIMDLESLIFSVAELKPIVTNIKSFLSSLRGEVRVYGLTPGFDKHIWNKLMGHKKITKIVISYFSEQDKQGADEMRVNAPSDKVVEIIHAKEFKNRYWN